MNAIIVVAECSECQCCLKKDNDDHHCYICHVEKSVEEICGCGDCPDKLEAWTQEGWRPWLNR